MSRDTFDAVLASTPNGATAGRVTSKGDHWTPEQECPEDTQHWSSPPPLQPFHPGPYNKPDMTGTKFGRFTVVGHLHRDMPGRARWVVRCACGDFEVRRTRGIIRMMAMPCDENAGQAGDRCHNCSQLLQIKHRYRTQGGRPISDFFTEVKS